MKYAIVALLGCYLLCSPLVAKNWPQWRGPDGNGVADPGDYPVKFSDQENVAWKVELPGRGSSTPAVWDDQIFVTCPIDGQDGVLCYDFAGNERWRQQLGSERDGKHRNGTGSNPSPVTDGAHLVVYYKSGTVACLDLAGEKRWQVNLQTLYGADTLWWDLGTSPILAAGNAVVAVMQDGDSFLVALDLENGEIAWKRERMFPCERESDQSYTTPHVATVDGRDVIVTWGADHLTGHDAATGEPLWVCGGFNPENEGMWRVIASAAVDNQVAVVPYGRGNFVAGIRLDESSGDITSSHRLWEKTNIGADVPTPVILGEQVLLLSDKGEVHCLNKMTGDEVWSDRLPRDKDKYFASPVLAGNTLYCAREDGVIMTSSIDQGLKDVQENDMGESIIATPVPLRGQLLVRGERHLFLISN